MTWYAHITTRPAELLRRRHQGYSYSIHVYTLQVYNLTMSPGIISFPVTMRIPYIMSQILTSIGANTYLSAYILARRMELLNSIVTMTITHKCTLWIFKWKVEHLKKYYLRRCVDS